MTGIERLSEVVRELGRFSFCYDLYETLGNIADQIEREQDAMVADSPYDALPPDERDAIAWVREHGGVEEVKKKWDGCVPVSWLEKAKSRYERKRDNLKAHAWELERKCGERRERIRELERERDELRTRLMPEGMEWMVEAWPRFEDDAPVRFLDDFERYGDENGVSAVTMYSDGSFALNCRAYSKGEHVNRPATKVLDSEGVECNVGDAVWWVRNKAGDFRIVRIESDGKCAIHDDDEDEPCGMTVPSTELTHVRPVLDADGEEIRVGDTVYHVKDGSKMTVFGIEGEWIVVSVGGRARHDFVTHRAPVLAADGRPLREGEVVWYLDHVDPLEVRSVSTTSSCGSYVNAYNDYEGEVSATAEDFTHERPETDSWERLEEDAKNENPVLYCKKRGIDCEDMSPVQAIRVDLVRRAKALAERDR